ncbi:MAG: CsbD family protein [Acidimicrobiales bacterium]
MGTEDKLSNKAQEMKGKVKEKVGSATGNEDLEAKGRSDQAKSALKDVGEEAKDAASRVKDALSHNK